ncbi:MAG: helix-turn-helix transcriptional regulator [Clostridia bacterium]|nr:helix-turn-helix transcriptional regulator [Clostridia bacterium]
MSNNDSIGLKILALRKSNGVTQADLGQHLNISYQAVSKWERGESLPDFDTLSKIARYFNVPITYFENKEEETEDEEVQSDEKREMLGVCKDCGKVLYTGDAGLEIPYLVCKPCVDRRKAAAKAKEAEQKRQEAKKREEERIAKLKREEAIVKSRNKGLIFGAIAAALLLILTFVFADYKNKDVIAGWIIGGILLSVVMFAFVSQLFWDGIVLDCVFLGGKIIGTPGIIWELSLDGFIFLIAMKILFALLRFLVWLASVLFFAVIAMIIAPFSFVPALIRVNSGDLVD